MLFSPIEEAATVRTAPAAYIFLVDETSFPKTFYSPSGVVLVRGFQRAMPFFGRHPTGRRMKPIGHTRVRSFRLQSRVSISQSPLLPIIQVYHVVADRIPSVFLPRKNFGCSSSESLKAVTFNGIELSDVYP